MIKNREIEHLYGPNVHILDDLWATSLLTQLSNENTPLSMVRQLAMQLYNNTLLRAVVDNVFPARETVVWTPMTRLVGCNRARLTVNTLDPATFVAIANLLRAGDLPSNTCMDALAPMMMDGRVTLQYFGAGRTTDDHHRVTGTAISYKKIDYVHDRILLIPDPMGATGGTIIQTLEEYGQDQINLTRAIVVMHLIITPEYVRRVTTAYPQVQIFALRLDRGMSSQEVIDSVPGTFPNREFGLNETQYIVPGAGDLGFRLTGIA